MQEKGQVLLLVLLSMAVVITVVLSVLSSSITDVSVSTREEESLRAFSAAEAGVEKTLIAGPVQNESIGDAKFTTMITSAGGGATNFIYPEEISSGEVATFWFVAHDTDGNLICNAASPCFTGRNLKFCWGNEGKAPNVPSTPAVEIAVYYLQTPGNYSTIRIARATYDPNSARWASNFFGNPGSGSCTSGGKTYAFGKTIDLSTLGIPASVYNTQNGLQLARVRMFYNPNGHPVVLDVTPSAPGLLPSQGDRIESVGTAGESTRKIEVYRLFADLPSIFEAAVFTPSGVTVQ